MLLACHSPGLDGFGSLKLFLRKTFLHHFFHALPSWCSYHNDTAFRAFFLGADMAWHHSWSEPKWTQRILFRHTNVIGVARVHKMLRRGADDNDGGTW